MKYLLTISFLFLLPLATRAQEIKIDRLKIGSGRMHPDSNFVRLLIETGDAYAANADKNDSAEAFYLEAMTSADKINAAAGVISARGSLADYYFKKGKLTQSLNLFLKNEAATIERQDSASLFNNLRVIAAIYIRIGDLPNAKSCLDRRQSIIDLNGIKGLKDTSYAVLSQYNSLAQYFSNASINKQDSAEYYFRKMYQKGKGTKQENLWLQLGGGGLGGVYTVKEMYDSAIYYYQISTKAALEGNRVDNYYGFLVALAEAYRKAGKYDSAFVYAYRVYDAATRYSYLSVQATSSGVLANLYKSTKHYDSAVKYMSIEAKFKDSLYSRESLKSIQLMTVEQQQREVDKQREKEKAIAEYKSSVKTYSFIGGLLLLLAIIGFMFRVNKQRTKSKQQIENAYNDLKATQAQLVQSEKMASLGELTAGIAHEIQNPLNFVNNFSEVNAELIGELLAEADKENFNEVKAIANDIRENEKKILHHGKRADAIVKGMLQHSQKRDGRKEPVNINALCDEYLRLSYHGVRAKDNSFSAALKTDFDDSIGTLNIVPQDIGRVIMNLLNNAFYAVAERRRQITADGSAVTYEPMVSILTKKLKKAVEISISDNGNGISPSIKDKIFQPFFTTKPTGQGTGLGLSLSYDIITKGHSGEMTVHTNDISAEGEQGTTFIIQLPA